MNRLRHVQRRGLTSLELLTVAGVALVLGALVMPSLLQARQAARSNRCAGNLRRIGLALLNYHDAHARFPCGWYTRTESAAAGPFFGWQYSLLPYVEEGPLFNRIDSRSPVPPPNDVLTTWVDVYICPADVPGEVNDVRGGYGLSFYSGNHGNERLPGSADTPAQANGIFWTRGARLRDITDGPSKTFAVGERGIASAAGIWVGVRANRHENDAVTDCSDQARINGDITSFSSLHGDGANFLFCDGAVRFLSESIDSRPADGGQLGVYQKLSQRNDNEPVGRY